MNERFQVEPWVWLLEVNVPTDPPQVVRICNGTKSLDFDSDNSGTPHTYKPTRFSFDRIRIDTEGSLPQLPLSISNVTREAAIILIEHRYLVKQPVRMILVNIGTIDNPEAKIEFKLEVKSSAVASRAVTFNLSSYSLNSVKAPVRHLSRTICDHPYGSALCGFDIDTLDPNLSTLGLCPKTEDGCTLRGDLEVAAAMTRQHPERIGLCKGLALGGQ